MRFPMKIATSTWIFGMLLATAGISITAQAQEMAGKTMKQTQAPQRVTNVLLVHGALRRFHQLERGGSLSSRRRAFM